MRLTKFVYFKCFLLSKDSFDHFSSSERYLIGSDQRLELSVEVTNEGEDAYEAALYVAMPSNVSYIKTEMLAQTNAGILQIFVSTFKDRVLYFPYLTKTLFSHIMQIWLFSLLLDTLSPFWSQSSLIPTI